MNCSQKQAISSVVIRTSVTVRTTVTVPTSWGFSWSGNLAKIG